MGLNNWGSAHDTVCMLLDPGCNLMHLALMLLQSLMATSRAVRVRSLKSPPAACQSQAEASLGVLAAGTIIILMHHHCLHPAQLGSNHQAALAKLSTNFPIAALQVKAVSGACLGVLTGPIQEIGLTCWHLHTAHEGLLRSCPQLPHPGRECSHLHDYRLETVLS